MTTRPPDDLHDERFDAAWKRASREEPSASLGDAIRAAARREVGARPQDVSSVREATRPERWWFPLAAAAMIGAIAIGLLQITSPDRIASVDEQRPVSDIPPGAKETNAPRVQAPSPPAASMPSAPAAEAPPVAPPQAPSSAPAAPPVEALAKQTPSSSSASADAARDRAAKRREAPQFAAAKPAEAPPRQANAVAEPQPFPAATPEESPRAARRDQSQPADALDEAPPAAAAPAPAAPPPAPNKTETAKDQPMLAQTRPNQKTVREAGLDSKLKSRLATAAPESAATASGELDAVSARAKMRASLPTDQWIVLMRRLLAEQHYDELAKELAAFRTLHADANLLLPADLRDFRPPAPAR